MSIRTNLGTVRKVELVFCKCGEQFLDTGNQL